MPMLDMPLSEMKQYKGTNPRPADFDQYWEKALSEMEALDPKVEMLRSGFQTPAADCYDLYFTGVGGARIHAQLLMPKGLDKPAPAVLQFHGYTVDAGNWNGKLNFVNEGFVVAAMDCRGQGGSSEDNAQVKGITVNGHIIRGLEDSPEKLLYRSIFLDAAQLARIIMQMDCVDETRVGAMGMSQGGGLTVACAALTPGINRIGVTAPFLSDYQRVWEIDMVGEAYHELQDFFRRRDPLHEKEELYFTRLGYIDVHHLAPRIKAKTLFSIGLQDTSCPPVSQFAIYNNLDCEKKLLIYPDFGHEDFPWFWDKGFMFLCEMQQTD